MSKTQTPTKKQTSMFFDITTIEYFKALAKKTGVPYQRLINLYLADCVKTRRSITIEDKDGNVKTISPDF